MFDQCPRSGRLPARRDRALMARCQETHSSARSSPERTAARKHAAEYFQRFPKDRYQPRSRAGVFCNPQNIEFTRSGCASRSRAPNNERSAGLETTLHRMLHPAFGRENIGLPLAVADAGTSSCITSQCSATLPPSRRNISTATIVFGHRHARLVRKVFGQFWDQILYRSRAARDCRIVLDIIRRELLHDTWVPIDERAGQCAKGNLLIGLHQNLLIYLSASECGELDCSRPR